MVNNTKSNNIKKGDYNSNKNPNDDTSIDVIKYKILFQDLQHQDEQLWQVCIFFFGINAALAFIINSFLENTMIININIILLIGLLGISINIIWYICADRIVQYTRVRGSQLYEIEAKKFNLDILKNQNKHLGKIFSVKPIYAFIIPIGAALLWALFEGIFLSL